MASSSPFPFLHFVEKLKETHRAGWVKRGIANPESVSDHMYRMCIMIMMLPGVSAEVKDRAIKMALVHDLAEAITGDITPADGVSSEEKYVREALAIEYLSILAKDVAPVFASEMRELWIEFEEGESEAAILVGDMDALECLDQALVYGHRFRRFGLPEEFAELPAYVRHPATQPWLQQHFVDQRTLLSAKSDVLPVVFVVGGPGSGKGTQCKMLGESFNCLYLSVGELLREEARDESSPYSSFINRSIKESVVVPADLTLNLIEKRSIALSGSGICGLLLDGFPRSMVQFEAFQERFPGRHSTMFLACSREVLQARLYGRSRTSIRSDDSPSVIVKRLATWESDDTSTFLSHLRKSTQFHEIDASLAKEDVFKEAKVVMDAILNGHSCDSV